MKAEIEILINQYVNWLKDKTQLRDVDGQVEITTPFLDRNNDYIQIYAAKDPAGGYLLSDDGETISDLEFNGMIFDKPKRKSILKMTLNGYGVSLEDEALVVKANPANFAEKKHSLIQSILAVNDLFYLASPYVSSLFLEDVTAFLDINEIRYSPKVKLTGKSGFDHLFDFIIPKSTVKPERLLKAINRPTKEQAESFLFAWTDTRATRQKDSAAFVFLNDSEVAPTQNVLSSLINYGVNPIIWTDRKRYIQELAA